MPGADHAHPQLLAHVARIARGDQACHRLPRLGIDLRTWAVRTPMPLFARAGFIAFGESRCRFGSDQATMLYFGRLKTTLILGVCILGALLCLPNLLRAARRLAAVAHSPSRPGPARRLLPAAAGGHGGAGQGAAGHHAGPLAPGAGRASTAAWRSRRARTASAVALRDPAQAQAATDALKTAAANPDGTQDFDIATRPDGTLSLTLNEAALRRPRHRRRAAIDRDRAPPHRRHRRARPADHPPGREPHRRAASRRGRPEPHQAAARHHREDDVPPGGRGGRPQPPRAARRRDPADGERSRTARSCCAAGSRWTAPA